MPVTSGLIRTIAEQMELANMNITTLSDKANLRRATVSDLLNEKRPNVPVVTIEKIAKALGMKLSELIAKAERIR